MHDRRREKNAKKLSSVYSVCWSEHMLAHGNLNSINSKECRGDFLKSSVFPFPRQSKYDHIFRWGTANRVAS
jgi:hypothetical protein